MVHVMSIHKGYIVKKYANNVCMSVFTKSIFKHTDTYMYVFDSYIIIAYISSSNTHFQCILLLLLCCIRVYEYKHRECSTCFEVFYIVFLFYRSSLFHSHAFVGFIDYVCKIN